MRQRECKIELIFKNELTHIKDERDTIAADVNFKDTLIKKLTSIVKR